MLKSTGGGGHCRVQAVEWPSVAFIDPLQSVTVEICSLEGVTSLLLRGRVVSRRQSKASDEEGLMLTVRSLRYENRRDRQGLLLPAERSLRGMAYRQSQEVWLFHGWRTTTESAGIQSLGGPLSKTCPVVRSCGKPSWDCIWVKVDNSPKHTASGGPQTQGHQCLFLYFFSLFALLKFPFPPMPSRRKTSHQNLLGRDWWSASNGEPCRDLQSHLYSLTWHVPKMWRNTVRTYLIKDIVGKCDK